MWCARTRVGGWVRLCAVGLFVAAGAVALGFAAPVATAAPAVSAATATRYVATTGSDAAGNDCTVQASPCRTIQNAVDQADSGDTVSVATGTYDEAVKVPKSLSIVGAGASGGRRTTVDGTGSGSDPSLTIVGTATTTPDVTVRDLDASGNTVSDGIRDDSATVTIEDTVVSENLNNGIAVESSLSPAVSPSATIRNVTVAGNGANVNGAGVLAFAGTTVISNSTITGNGAAGVNVAGGSAKIESSTLDANAGVGLLVNPTGSATLTDSTVSDTVPFSRSDAPDPFGAGVLAMSGASAGIGNSTVAGNTGQGILSEAATIAVDNSTIAGTKAPASKSALPGGGVVMQNASAGPAVRSAIISSGLEHPRTTGDAAPSASVPGLTLTGTLVAQQSGVPDCTGSVADKGYSLDSDGSCALSATGSVSKGTAKLGALGDHRGPTQTLVPAKGSQAIDAIPSTSAGCAKGASDQRGTSRPQGPKCDIGAIEVAQLPLVITPAGLPDGTVGTAYHMSLSATGGLGAPYVFSPAPGSSLPAGLSLSKAGVLSGTPTVPGTFSFAVSVDDPVHKRYSLTITAPSVSSPVPASPVPTLPGTGSQLAATGSNAQPLGQWGAGLLFGGLLLLGAGRIRRSRGRHIA